jgi:hypothetical protein
MKTPRISISVKKFCGKKTFEVLNLSIKAGLITNVQAQYLIFGAVNKKGYLSYRRELRI